MLTVSVYFRIKNHELFNGEDGYIGQSMDFDTSDNPKGLQKILELPEVMRENMVKSLNLQDSDVIIISKSEYEEETKESED